MLKNILALLLKTKTLEIKTPAIYPVSLERSFPELQHVELELLQKMSKTMRDLEVFCTIVQCLNEGLEDTRLETIGGTLQALKQLQEYSFLTKRSHAIVVNKGGPKTAKLPLIFFEV